MRKSDLYQLYINALDRLRPDAMAGWLIASNLYGAIILGSVLMGIFNNVQLNNTLWHTIGIVATVFYIIQIVVMIFFFSIKNSYKYQKFLSLWTSIVVTKLSMDSYLFLFATLETKGDTKPIAYYAYALIGIGILLLIILTIRGFKRLKNGEFRKEGKYLYDFCKSKRNIGAVTIFPIVLIVIDFFRSIQSNGYEILSSCFFLIICVVLQYILVMAIPEFYLLTYCKFKYSEFTVDIPKRLLKNTNKNIEKI